MGLFNTPEIFFFDDYHPNDLYVFWKVYYLYHIAVMYIRVSSPACTDYSFSMFLLFVYEQHRLTGERSPE